MEMPDYIINPVRMSGLVKETDGEQVKVHLRGRLGVIVIPRKLIRGDDEIVPGHALSFYFSYLQVVHNPLDYDDTGMMSDEDIFPVLLGGKIIEVNDTAARIAIMDHLGTVAVPRRWIFTPVRLENGLYVEFYFSRMDVTGRRDIPWESI